MPDPYLLTFDGLYYSFQTAGEFVLVKESNGGTFQVQARISAPIAASTYSVITEIGIQVGHDVVTIDSTRAAPVWVDGKRSSAALLPLCGSDVLGRPWSGLFELSLWMTLPTTRRVSSGGLSC